MAKTYSRVKTRGAELGEACAQFQLSNHAESSSAVGNRVTAKYSTCGLSKDGVPDHAGAVSFITGAIYSGSVGNEGRSS